MGHTGASSRSQASYRKTELFCWHQCVLDVVLGFSPSEVNTVHQSLVHQRVNPEQRWISWNFPKSFAFLSTERHAIRMYNMISLELQFVFNQISFLCITIGSLLSCKSFVLCKTLFKGGKKLAAEQNLFSMIRPYLFNALSGFYYYFGTWHLPKALKNSWEVLQLYSVFTDANSDKNLTEDKFNEH